MLFRSQDCILTVSRKNGLYGLEQWLKNVVFLDEESRGCLKYQLEFMLSGRNPLVDLRPIIKYGGDVEALSEQLASLPRRK